MTDSESQFDQLINDALAQDFSGWDFTYVKDRWREGELPWDYAHIVRERIPSAKSMLDMGTGGGEFLSSLAPLPLHTCATEGYPPNVPIARARLEPLGVSVYHVEKHPILPLQDSAFDLVINRHEAFDSGEVYRVLKSGSWFITQQVGGENYMRLNDLLMGAKPRWYITLEGEAKKLKDAGFEIIETREAFPETHISDIGAVVFYLKAVPWQVPDFSIEKYRERLLEIHRMIEQDGYLPIKCHRFLIVTRKP